MKVSLYIPAFNVEETIQPCLEAVFKQTYFLEEVIVVDDGSTDKTVEIASRYPVNIIKNVNNRGLASARNIAIRNTNSEFIASLDADCLPEPDWLEQLMRRFDLPKIAGVGGKLSETYSHTAFDLWRSIHMKQHWEKEKSPSFLFGSNTVFRRESIIKAGLYNEDFKNNYEDVDISSRLRKDNYDLIYEPKARVHHLKRDDIYSILSNYWRWNLGYYESKLYYSNQKNFVLKIEDNIGLANRYIKEDIASGKNQLLYLDFLLGLHHSLKDFEYFITQGSQECANHSRASSWLSLLDLTFFYHFDCAEENLSTLMPETDISFQNFIALSLVIGKSVKERFGNRSFQKILYKHLLLSVYKMDDEYLLDKLLNIIELGGDWNQFYKKRHPYLNAPFLESLYINFNNWLNGPTFRSDRIIGMIEASAERTDESLDFKKEGCSYENR